MKKLIVTSLIAGGLSLLALPSAAQAQGGCGHYYYRGSDGYCYQKGGYGGGGYGNGYGYGYGYRSHRPRSYYGHSWRHGWGDDGYGSYYRRGYYGSWW